MELPRPLSKLQWKREAFGDQHGDQPQSHVWPLLEPSRLHPAKALRQQMLVSELFERAQEIRSFAQGYAFRFDRSDDLETLLGTMAEYIVLESLNSPTFTVVLDEAPEANGFWLRVRHEGVRNRQSLGALPSLS